MSKRLFLPTSPPPAAKRVQRARLPPSLPSPSPPLSKPPGASDGGVDPDAIPSVFDILNIFRSRWFLNKDHLIANVLSAQRDADGRLCWVDFLPPFHTHLVQRALALVPPLCPAAMGKKVLFVFVMEVMDGDGPKPGSFWIVPKKRRRRPPPAKSPPPPSVPEAPAPAPPTRPVTPQVSEAIREAILRPSSAAPTGSNPETPQRTSFTSAA